VLVVLPPVPAVLPLVLPLAPPVLALPELPPVPVCPALPVVLPPECPPPVDVLLPPAPELSEPLLEEHPSARIANNAQNRSLDMARHYHNAGFVIKHGAGNNLVEIRQLVSFGHGGWKNLTRARNARLEAFLE